MYMIVMMIVNDNVEVKSSKTTSTVICQYHHFPGIFKPNLQLDRPASIKPICKSLLNLFVFASVQPNRS